MTTATLGGIYIYHEYIKDFEEEEGQEAGKQTPPKPTNSGGSTSSGTFSTDKWIIDHIV